MTDQPADGALEPFIGFDSLPALDPQALARDLIERFDTAWTQIVAERTARLNGRQPTEEDVWETARIADHVDSLAEDYEYAFKQLRTRTAAALQDEAVAVHGEQDGVPNGALTVPSGGRTLTVAPQYKTTQNIDMGRVVAALAALVEQEWIANGTIERNADVPAALLVPFALDVVGRVTSEVMLKADPSIKGVRALRAMLGHHGLDQMAGAVGDAIQPPTRVFQRIKVTRTDPK